MNLHTKIKNLFNNKQLVQNRLTKYVETGQNLIEEINNHNPKLVLDLGCGENFYKGRIKNLIGVDILDDNKQDITAPIEDLPFEDNYADIILALGSINFGDDELIDKQIIEMKRVAKPNALIYFKILPEHNVDPYYFWTFDKLMKKTKEHNLYFEQTPKEIYRNSNAKPSHHVKTGFRSKRRLYCIWKVIK